MSAAQFRKIALSMPEAEERQHMGHPDFRVGGKIFATLFERSGVEWGMVKLTPDDQDRFIAEWPETFSPVPGAWGEHGCTQVRLKGLKQRVVREAIEAAWRARR